MCTPFATSIISDYIDEVILDHHINIVAVGLLSSLEKLIKLTASSLPQSSRGAALGFYNWGIYIGYSLAFAFNFILLSIGWRWAFRIASFPGFLLAGLLFITVKEPERRQIGDVHVCALCVYGRRNATKLLFRAVKMYLCYGDFGNDL